MSLTDIDHLDPDTTEPAPARSLPTQRTRVTLLDGTTFTVRVSQRDYIQWDLTAPRKKWGKAEDVPFLARAFVVYAAAKRQGMTELGFESFRDALDDLEEIEVDDSDTVRPT